MQRQTSNLLVLGLALALAACGQDATDPTTSLTDSSTRPSAGGPVDRPLRGTCGSQFEFFDFVFLPPPEEDVPVSARIHQEGTCRLTHVGRTTLVLDQGIDFTVVPAHITGELVLTAANGDQLFASEVSDVSPPDEDLNFEGAGTWTWTGGTGRFEGVRGLVSWTAVGTLVNNTVSRDIRGRISY